MKIEKNKTFNFIELSEVKSHLRINQSFLNDDQYLNLLIKSATRIAEDFIADDIALTNVTLTISDFYDKYLDIPTVNLSGVTISGDSTSISGYSINYHFNYQQIEFDNYVDVDELVINYSSGYNSTTIQPAIKQAILIKIGELYDIDRNGYVMNNIKYSRSFENLLNPYRILI
jgi:hypothetical protein